MKQKQVLNNAKWIIICKICQSIIQLLIGMLCARYLGPSNYGLINYAASIVAFALPVMKLGLDAVLVYELVSEPNKEGEILGTSLCMNIVSGLLCVIAVSAFSIVANWNESETIVVCVLYSICIFFAAFEMMQFWFQYKLLSKYSSVVALIAYTIVSVYKVYLLVDAKSVNWFAISHAIEYGVIGFSLLIIYRKCKGQRFAFSICRAKSLLSKGKYYILAALLVVVIQNTDHIMLSNIIGKRENGFYSAAITSAAVAQFVYLAIIDSYRPLILAAKQSDRIEYEQNLSRLYCIIIYMAFANGIVFTIFARLIINILYGPAYLEAVPVFRILVWYLSFSYMGIIRNIWLLAEEKQRYLPIINSTGMIINIVLNSIFIPVWGACGAAGASLITQFFMNFVLGFFVKALRENNRLIIKGLSPRFFCQTVKGLLMD